MQHTMQAEYSDVVCHVMDQGDRREDIVPDVHQVDRRTRADA